MVGHRNATTDPQRMGLETGRILSVVQMGAAHCYLLFGVSLSTRKASLMFLLILFLTAVLLQIADGALTYQGVSLYGTAVEGNPLVRWTMNTLSPVTALVLFKGAAIVILSYIYFCTPHTLTIKYWMYGILVIFYLSLAILPWLYFLTKK